MAASDRSKSIQTSQTTPAPAQDGAAPALRLVPPSNLRETAVGVVARTHEPRQRIDYARFVLNLMIVAAGICLYHGVTEPIIKLTQMFVFSDTHSLSSAVLALYYDGEAFLATIILVFSMLMPTAKLLYLLALGSLPIEDLRQRHGWLKRLEWFGKWSMHDVLILALTIVYLRAEGISKAVSMPGVRWFAAAVILIMLAYGWLKRTAGAPYRALDAARTTTMTDEGRERPSELRRFFLGLLTLAATATLVLGVTQPAIQLTKLYLWTDRHSILTAIYALYLDNEYFLAGLIFLFSVILPSCKLLYLLVVSTIVTPRPSMRERTIERLESLGKWSMMDVLVLALMVFYVNASAIADATALPGIYLYAVSVFLTMIAYAIAKSGLRPRPISPAPPSDRSGRPASRPAARPAAAS
jgi:paraquat-inducible protein A